MQSSHPIVTINNLHKSFRISTNDGKKNLHALSDISLTINKGEVLSIIGESGCGKTTLGKTVLLLEQPTKGEVFFEGNNILNFNKEEMKGFRKEAQMIFQNPFASLNPRRTIESTIMQPLLIHENLSRQEMSHKIDSLLEDVGISPRYKKRYPHQFSGGQRQRINIARAIATRPKFIVCDEAVSALDVSVQAQILNLLLDLKDKYDLTYLFISHDLATVDFISDRICVMYLGKIAEFAHKKVLSNNNLHPYTKMLFDSHPIADPHTRKSTEDNYVLKAGDIPSPINMPKGCPFSTRCIHVMDKCKETIPTLKNYSHNDDPHNVACHLLD